MAETTLAPRQLAASPAPLAAGSRAHALPPEVAHALLLAGLALVVFAHGFLHDFTNWDDHAYIVENPTIRELSWQTLARAFGGFHVLNYNPLHILSYALDHAVWGLEPAGFFLSNLVLHATAGVLVYLIALWFVATRGAAFFAAALFVVHPTRVESVVWLSQRKDVLSACFVLASLLAYLHGVRASSPARRRALAIVAWSLFVLACLAKSQVVAFPLLLVAVDSSQRRPLARALPGKLPYLAVSVVFALVTLAAHEGGAQHGIEFPDCITAPLAAVSIYAAHLAWPVGLSPYYDLRPEDFASAPRVAAGALLTVVALVVAWRSWQRERVLLVAVACFVAFTLPVLGIVRINVQVADRYLYLAIAGAAILLARAGSGLRVPRRTKALAAGALVATLSVATIAYVPVFRNSVSLWRHVLERAPGCSLAHSNLGHHYLGAGRYDLAIAHYDADLAARPIFETSLLGRALLHEHAGELRAAEALLRHTVELQPESDRARAMLEEFVARHARRALTSPRRPRRRPPPPRSRSRARSCRAGGGRRSGSSATTRGRRSDRRR